MSMIPQMAPAETMALVGLATEQLRKYGQQAFGSRRILDGLARRANRTIRRWRSYSGALRYAAPWRKRPADGSACENTMRMGTKMALLPGVNGTATSARLPSGY